MGHEATVFGCVGGADPENLRGLNAAAIAALPADDDWPFLVRGMFALPEVWPRGTYRTHVIHFGASLKDDPADRAVWDLWLVKFEAVLRQLYWWSATLHLHTEFEPDRVFEWTPTSRATERMFASPPEAVQQWDRAVTALPTTRG